MGLFQIKSPLFNNRFLRERGMAWNTRFFFSWLNKMLPWDTYSKIGSLFILNLSSSADSKQWVNSPVSKRKQKFTHLVKVYLFSYLVDVWMPYFGDESKVGWQIWIIRRKIHVGMWAFWDPFSLSTWKGTWVQGAPFLATPSTRPPTKTTSDMWLLCKAGVRVRRPPPPGGGF